MAALFTTLWRRPTESGISISFNIPPISLSVKSIKINIAQNKKAGLERSQGATCGLPAQVRQKHLHCTEKPYPAGKSPVLKVLRRITVITCRLCSFKSWNAQHGNHSCCYGCSGCCYSDKTRHSWKHCCSKNRHVERG